MKDIFNNKKLSIENGRYVCIIKYVIATCPRTHAKGFIGKPLSTLVMMINRSH